MAIDGRIFESGRDCGRTALRLGRPYGGIGAMYRLTDGSSNPEEIAGALTGAHAKTQMRSGSPGEPTPRPARAETGAAPGAEGG